MIDPVLGAKLTFVLGIVNVVGLILVFFSCRCLMGQRLFGFLSKAAWYQKFYRSHCRGWYVFFAAVLLHALLAFITYGNPF